MNAALTVDNNILTIRYKNNNNIIRLTRKRANKKQIQWQKKNIFGAEKESNDLEQIRECLYLLRSLIIIIRIDSIHDYQ